jgi:hypothetical protein
VLRSAAASFERASERPPVPVWVVSCSSESDVRRAAHLGADAALVEVPLAAESAPLHLYRAEFL